MALIDILAPSEQEGTKATVRAWLKAVGDRVEANEPLIELETDKVAMEVAAPVSGTLTEILATPGTDAPAGLLLGRIETEAAATPDAPAAPPQPGLQAAPGAAEPAPSAPALLDPALRLAPGVRRLIAEHGLDPAAIAGSGRNGRITRADVEAAIAFPRSAPEPAAPAPQSEPAASRPGASRSRQIPHSPMRRRIAEHMARSVSEAPHVTAVFEADFSAIIAHRAAHRAAFERDGIALTYTAYIVAACVEAMRAVPEVNARFHADSLEIFEDINIGVGTALGNEGLIVPVVHRAQQLSLAGIAARLQDMTARARASRLTPADVANGTFSISNHGVSGTLVAVPIIINQPQVAILGVGKLEKRVVVREIGGVDAIQIRPMAYVSLTIDHRALDGHQTNAWLARFVDVLESWPLER